MRGRIPASSAPSRSWPHFEEGVLRIPLPQFADPERRRQVEQLIRDFAEQVIALLQEAETKA